ncbi:tetratricopeptide repeat protein [Dyadobacter tibetensis]|uniref:tetratricopeptide repeat protein n=1 Tax=Dyadobacter tibetensis TaxID=1211851 RepID=UPI00046F4FDE|nr:tetratricopeptide repeat protein [Dyadobacter tibetensis]
MKLRLFAFVLFTLNFNPVQQSKAQLLNDPAAMKTIQKSLDRIYNLEFAEAQKLIDRIEVQYPGHPVSHILDSFVLFWKYLPVKDHKTMSKVYVQHLNKCLDAVDKKFGKDSKDPEAVFYTMVARGYLAMMYNYNGEMLSAASEGKKAYNAFTEGLKLTNKNPEFYFTSGMYNYYVEVYPEEHPIVKPLLIFFKSGDKELGLRQIEIGTRLGTITKAESCFYLAHIFTKYENKTEKAASFMQKLVDWYPQNPLYAMKYAEALLLAGRFDQAEDKLNMIKKISTGFYPGAYQTFQGLVFEKSLRNDQAAKTCYLASLKLPHDSQYTEEYISIAYAGLARIAHREGDKAKAKAYYKKCLEKAEYRALVAEAKAYK